MTEPVFRLQSVPGWEHERVDDPGWLGEYDSWSKGPHHEIRLHDDEGGVEFLLSRFAPATPEQARELVTLFAMIAQELERREREA